LVSEEDSPFFNIGATSFANDSTIQIAEQTGMFAYPAISSIQSSSRERAYLVAYLQAIFPEQSETSRYRVVVMDRDTGQSRGFGFVEMQSEDDAKTAIDRFNDSDLDGRRIAVNVAQPKPAGAGAGAGGRGGFGGQRRREPRW
jgi:hypothetical protein